MSSLGLETTDIHCFLVCDLDKNLAVTGIYSSYYVYSCVNQLFRVEKEWIVHIVCYFFKDVQRAIWTAIFFTSAIFAKGTLFYTVHARLRLVLLPQSCDGANQIIVVLQLGKLLLVNLSL